MKYYFECFRCRHVHEASHQRYKFFLGNSCEKCGGELIESKKGELQNEPSI